MSRKLVVSLAMLALACTKSPSSTDDTKKIDAGIAGKAGGPVAKAPPPKKADLPAPPDVAAPPADAEKTASGLAFKVLKKGTSEERPDKWDDVTVHYTGWTTDGKMFDSSVTKGRPANFNLKNVVKGWTEGIPLMAVGEQRRFWIPEELAYKGKRGPQGMLVFDVELLSIKRGKPPIPPPADVAAAPANATKLKSGVAYVSLAKGKAGPKPKPEDVVKVHYTGWTTDGEMFDSSVNKGKWSAFPANAVIAGWTEALQLMNVGDKWRIWIPEEHAYKGQEGRPKGMLVFEIELLGIVDFTAPKDIAAPPADAEKLPSGLATKLIAAGTGTEKPSPTARVEAHYIAWTSDGKVADSSYKRGRPLMVPVNRGLKGWQEGLPMMVVGEKRRFWIPENLAYEGREGAPKGMLVYDFEMLSFEEPKVPPPDGGPGMGGHGMAPRPQLNLPPRGNPPTPTPATK